MVTWLSCRLALEIHTKCYNKKNKINRIQNTADKYIFSIRSDYPYTSNKITMSKSNHKPRRSYLKDTLHYNFKGIDAYTTCWAKTSYSTQKLETNLENSSPFQSAWGERHRPWRTRAEKHLSPFFPSPWLMPSEWRLVGETALAVLGFWDSKTNSSPYKYAMDGLDVITRGDGGFLFSFLFFQDIGAHGPGIHHVRSLLFFWASPWRNSFLFFPCDLWINLNSFLLKYLRS